MYFVNTHTFEPKRLCHLGSLGSDGGGDDVGIGEELKKGILPFITLYYFYIIVLCYCVTS